MRRRGFKPPPMGEVPQRGGEGLRNQQLFDVIRLDFAILAIDDIDAPLTANVSHRVVSIAETCALPCDRFQNKRIVAASASEAFAQIRHEEFEIRQ